MHFFIIEIGALINYIKVVHMLGSKFNDSLVLFWFSYRFFCLQGTEIHSDHLI